mgnify:CR=1 FL=1
MYGIIIIVLPHMIRKVIHMQLKFRKEERLMDLEMVKYLAKLGKLSFTDEELEQAVKDMTSIIEIMDTIKEIDITYDPLKDNRKDEAKPSLPTEKLLQNAVSSENCFVVPKVVE